MPTDLIDAVAAWQGGDISEARCQELLARLRVDAEFRSAFADEIWMLSLTRTAQSPNPRWLALCEELGIQPAGQPETESKLESMIMQSVQQRPLRVVRQWWRAAAIGTTGIAAALALYLGLQPSMPTAFATYSGPLATLLQSTVKWSDAQAVRPAKGQNVHAGKLELAAGTLTLLFRSGVILQAQGPASIELISGDQVVCHHGKVRTRVPKGAEGFRVDLPHGRVTDLGTEMGVNVELDGRARVAVFEGLAEATLKLPNQDGTRTEAVGANRAVEMLPATGELKPSDMNDFLSATELSLPSLTMRSDYGKAVRAAQPLHYWRLNRADQGLVPNEMPSAVALRMGTGVSLQADERRNLTAHFDGQKTTTGLIPQEPLTLPRSGWAVEFWFVSSTADQSSLATLALDDNDPLHVMIVEYNTIIPSIEMRRSVRFLMRWPAESHGGVNLFSKPTFLPYQWHHVVAQQQAETMELWVDGRRVGRGICDPLPDEIRGHFSFGATTILAPVTHDPIKARQLSGRMAEIAIYHRTLSEDEIRQHAAIGGKN